MEQLSANPQSNTGMFKSPVCKIWCSGRTWVSVEVWLQEDLSSSKACLFVRPVETWQGHILAPMEGDPAQCLYKWFNPEEKKSWDCNSKSMTHYDTHIDSGLTDSGLLNVLHIEP